MSNVAWQYTERGFLGETLKQASRPIPSPGPDEVVIKIKAAALNPVDIQLAQSSDWALKFLGIAPMGTPFVPGNDFAGVVYAVGSNVSQWSVGDKVYGMNFPSSGNGSLQQYYTLPAAAAIQPIPPSLDFKQAASLPLVYSTVYGSLVETAKLPFSPPPEERGKRSVLVLGGSSGTGSVAIQMAKKMGLRVVATCSEKNMGFVKSLGADELIDYRTENVVERALHSPHAPFAAIFDCVGGKDLLPHLDNLILDDPKNPHLGMYITIVGDKTGRDEMGGPITYTTNPIQTLRYYRGRLQDYLPSWFPLKRIIANKRYAVTICMPTQEQFATVPEYLKSAKEITIDSVFSFADVKQAYERLNSARAVGKIVIEVE